MKKRPTQPIKTCDCCLMPDSSGVQILRFHLTLPSNVMEITEPHNYCELCARHILSLGVPLKRAD